MSVTLPLPSGLPDFEFQIELESVTYGLRFRLNLRDGGWYVDLLDADGGAIASAQRFVLNVPLFRRSSDARKPPGALIAQSTTADDGEPGPTDLGTRVRLLYFTAAEVAAVG